MKKIVLSKETLARKAPIRLFLFLMIFVATLPTAYPLNDFKKVEELVVVEKKIEAEKEKSLIEHFYSEGKRLLEEGDIEGAVDNFSRILEIDPNHRGAKSGIKKIRKKLQVTEGTETPDVMARRLLRNGRLKYANRDYEGAIEDFQDALVLDYTNEEILEWLKRARRRDNLKEIDTEEKDLLKDTEVATRRKEAQEKAAMLEVETAYLPPEKPDRKPVEIEELISPEEEMEEKARQELLKKLQEKMVPAVNLTEANIRDVIRQLMEITGVTIVIDEGALAEAVGEEPLKITFSTVNPLPLLEVLDIALRATGLGYKVERNYLWISTPEKLAREKLVTKTYRVKHGVRRIRKVQLKEFKTKSSETE